ncbi:deubiquitinase DESI2 [Marchantia polymorpha subsp. ruderalis]|uniref:PPPDE domain-containing protein n=1 Tax=Marchantia polymorpha TaxID=3197 RepID=A0A2R6XGH7_MARPO|nr:hypothetical protein MARPO_0015s0018 [Marchantia polymorpha]BBN01429.1 hypothetical protein Mp_2g07310 [Marchantia polymorpha subsp. ruderalis]|eukprot:PTQ45198.1 hypothetical protein MARPO_0015s0018 [Marchantia polymorpha]
MTEVWLHVYDVTNSMSVKANNAIIQLNKLMRDGIGVGGIFHGAIQVYDEEWSFGFCETGSGVFSCPPKENPMYTYRESVHLGTTNLSHSEVNVIIRTMIAEWPGCDYDLLSKNCNHFCEAFCAELHVDKLPLWVNRFAKTGDAAVEVAGNTMERLKQAKAEVVTAGKVAYRFLFGGPTSSTVSPDPGLSDSRQNGSNSSRRFSLGFCLGSLVDVQTDDVQRIPTLHNRRRRSSRRKGTTSAKSFMGLSMGSRTLKKLFHQPRSLCKFVSRMYTVCIP